MKKTKPGAIKRRKFISSVTTGTLGLLSSPVFSCDKLGGKPGNKAEGVRHSKLSYTGWQIGIGKAIITPQNGVWLAGYGKKRVANRKLHDLWAKVIALKDKKDKRVVRVTTDHMGMSKTINERLFIIVRQRYQLDRSQFMLTFSHNHCGPCLVDDLVDYYPSDQQQEQLVSEYTAWMEIQIIEAVDEALSSWQSCELIKGEGKCTFAVNRRENIEADVPEMLANDISLKGAVDHYVPVLAARAPGGHYLALLFGYACHPTTWVCGYANYMVAYIPSRRVWEEGGYEGGPHLDEYGHPAWKWKGDIEDRIADSVQKVFCLTKNTRDS